MNLSVFSVRWLLRGIFTFLMIGLLANAGTARAQFLVEVDGTPGAGQLTLSLSGAADFTGGGSTTSIIDTQLPNFISGSQRVLDSNSITGTCSIERPGIGPQILNLTFFRITDLDSSDDVLKLFFANPPLSVFTGRRVECEASATFAVDIEDFTPSFDYTTSAFPSFFGPSSLRVRNVAQLPPKVTIDPGNLQPVNGERIGVDVFFSDPVTGFTQSDLAVTNGTVTNFSGSGRAYAFDLTPDGPGAVLINIPAGVAESNDNIGNTAADQVSLQWTNVPVLKITSSESGDLVGGSTDTQANAFAGTEKTVTYTVENSGAADLIVSSVDLSALTNVDPLINVTPSSLTVPAGDTESFDVKYTPTDLGAFGFAIRLMSNDHVDSDFGFKVVGTAADGDGPTGYSVEIDQDPINLSNHMAVSFSLADAEIGTTYDYVFSSSGGNATIIGSGNVTTADQQVKDIDVSSLDDGTITLIVKLTDSASNPGDAVSDTSTKDTSPPTGYYVEIEQDLIDQSNADAVSFSLEDAEPNATYNYEFKSSAGSDMVIGSGTVLSSSQRLQDIDLSSLEDGTITLTLTLTDTAGNKGADTVHTSTKDTTEPEIDLLTPATVVLADGATHTQSDVVAGTEETITYTVRNNGNAILNVMNITATARNNIDGAVIITPTNFDVTGGNDSTFVVTYTPAVPGAFSFELDLTSNDDDEANYDLTIDGTAADGDAPTGYSVEIDQDPINLSNHTAVSFSLADAEIGTTYNYAFSSSGTGPTVIGSGQVTEVDQKVTGIDVSGLDDGTITLTVKLTDSASNPGADATDTALKDALAPSLSERTPVVSPSNDQTPDYVFDSNEAGTITYSGACASAATDAVAGDNTITFNSLADGTYDNCSLIVTDSAGNPSTPLSISPFTIDTAMPTLAEVTAVASPGNDPTPDYVFSSSKAGTITYSGACTSAATDAVAGDNTITFNSLADGTYDNCSLIVTDSAGNPSTPLSISPFTIDTAMPTLAEVTAVASPGNDPTPDYVFSSSKAGTITYSGACTSAATDAVAGDNTITFNSLADGTYDNCSLIVSDSAGNPSTPLSISPFSIDTAVPTLAEVTAVASPGNDATPDYVFSSSKAGTIAYTGVCTSAATDAVAGENTITFNSLADGTYDNCSLIVSDSAGNSSTPLSISPFSIDTAVPTLAEVTAVASPGNDATPDYVFSSSKAGTIAYTGVCTSAATDAVAGENTITFNSLADGTYDSCGLMVTDATGNPSAALGISPFTIDTAAPLVSEVIASPANEDGTIPLRIVFSETVIGFDSVEDLILETGTITAPEEVAPQDGTTYELVFTPDDGFSGEIEISLSETAAADASGNMVSGTLAFAVSVELDTPTIVITSDRTELSSNEAATLTFTLSAFSTDFDLDDISVTGGTLSDFSGADDVYYAIFSPDMGQVSTNGVGTVSVAAGVFSDAAGNLNEISNVVQIDFSRAIIDRTSRIILNFMSRRADQITANEPNLSARLNRHMTQSSTAGRLTGQGDLSSQNSLGFETSLRQIAAWQQRDVRALTTDEDRPEIFGAVPMAQTHGNVPIDAWVKATYAQIDNETASSSLGLVYAGADALVQPGLVLGLMGQLDLMDETDEHESFAASGTGWMAGPYLVAELESGVIVDARVAWGQSENDIRPFDTYADTFDTERWLLASKLTGATTLGDFDLAPELGLIYYEETQLRYVDSNGLTIPSHDVALGRLTLNPNFSRRIVHEDGSSFTFNGTVKGIWDFDAADLIDLESGIDAARDADLRARTEAGFAYNLMNGISLRAEGFYDGIGVKDYDAYGGTVSISIPLE